MTTNNNSLHRSYSRKIFSDFSPENAIRYISRAVATNRDVLHTDKKTAYVTKPCVFVGGPVPGELGSFRRIAVQIRRHSPSIFTRFTIILESK